VESKLPKISIVVPSYNQSSFLQKTLDSIFSQEYPNLEVVVMDGGSNDASVRIIQTYQEKLKYWQSQPDGGQANAINMGMSHCSGDIVAWLNSDDWYINESFWIIAHAFQENPEGGLFIGNGFRYKGGLYKPFCPRHIAIQREMLDEGLDYILQPATFVSRAAWLLSGGLDPELCYGLDWDLFSRILKEKPAVLINEFLAVSREYEQTKTASGNLTRAKELLNIADQNAANKKTFSRAYYWMVNAIHEALALKSEYEDSQMPHEESPLINELLRIVSQCAHKTITLGSAFYFLETLLSIDIQSNGFPDECRKPIYLAMQRIQLEMKNKWGTPDPFPIQMDEQDKVFIPFAKSFGHNEKFFQTVKFPPKISIIVPSYNQAEFLSKTLESIIYQNYPALEIMVFDGESTDESVEIIQSYASHLAFWQSEADLGPAHAINKGLAMATGEIVGWLNSDDVLVEDALWMIAQEFVENPGTEVVFGNALYIDEQDHLFLADHGAHKTGLYFGELEPLSKVPYYWTYVHAIPQPTVYFHRQLLEKTGFLDQSYQFIFDFEFFWRLRKKSKFQKIEKTLALYRIHSRSKTSNWNKFLKELFRFSRPLWPDKNTSEYQTVTSSLLHHYFSKKYGRYRRRNFIEKQIIKFIIENRIANPESLATPLELSILVKKIRVRVLHLVRDLLREVVAKVYRYSGKLLKNSLRRLFNPASIKNKPENSIDFANILPETLSRQDLTYSIDNKEKKYTITYAGFLFPRHPGHSGGEIRDFHILRKLLSISTLDFFALFNPSVVGNQKDLRSYFRLVYDPKILNTFLPDLVDNSALDQNFSTRLLRWLRNKKIPVYGPNYHNDFTNFAPLNKAYVLRGLHQILRVYKSDFLFVGPQLNPLPLQLSYLPEKTRLILSSYDVEAIRMERIAASQKGLAGIAMRWEANRAQVFEHDTLQHYDGIIAVSETDKDAYVQRYHFDPNRILALDNSVDTDYFSFRPRIKTENPNIVFIGSLGYWPNDEAAQRLIKDIMPVVRRDFPTARVWVVGQSPSEKLLSLSDGDLDIITGQVDDVRPFLDMATLACIPLQTGSGTKYKVLEAASAGVPIVCTPLALEGLSLRLDDHVLVGQTDQELASAILMIILNPESRIMAVQHAVAHVEEHYSWNRNLEKLSPWLDIIQKMPKRTKPIFTEGK
jgi:glycosyltransferase involved in cell wall biosynthesis